MLYDVLVILVIAGSVVLMAWAFAKMWNTRPVSKGPTMFPDQKEKK